jgi:hypothetical protein
MRTVFPLSPDFFLSLLGFFSSLESVEEEDEEEDEDEDEKETGIEEEEEELEDCKDVKMSNGLSGST